MVIPLTNLKTALAKIFDYVGFLPLFNIEFRRPFSRHSGGESVIGSLYEEYQRASSVTSLDSTRKLDFERDLLPSLLYLQNRRRNNKTLSLRIDLQHGWWEDSEFQEFSGHVLPLLKSGILKATRLGLFDKKTKDKVPFQHASSGQQCMLLMFLGITGAISNNSLICIDEPEISLHPKWQAEFIGIIQDVFSSYSGCHFLIATHSPQMIAGLVSENGFVADLESNSLLHSSEYARRSADFQLTEIFHEPGFKNEYLIRTLLVLLSKLSKNEQLSDDDRSKLQHIEYIKGRLDEGDPVLHLLNQVKMLAR